MVRAVWPHTGGQCCNEGLPAALAAAVDDDILLEVVMFVGVLCNEGTALMLVESGLVSVAYVPVQGCNGAAACLCPACNLLIT
jgi:hypothetical protein